MVSQKMIWPFSRHFGSYFCLFLGLQGHLLLPFILVCPFSCKNFFLSISFFPMFPFHLHQIWSFTPPNICYFFRTIFLYLKFYNQGSISQTGLHKLWYPGIRDTSTWSKFGAHGEHIDVFLFSNLGALWFSENLIKYSLHVCLREVKNNLFSFKHSYLGHFSWRF